MGDAYPEIVEHRELIEQHRRQRGGALRRDAAPGRSCFLDDGARRGDARRAARRSTAPGGVRAARHVRLPARAHRRDRRREGRRRRHRRLRRPRWRRSASARAPRSRTSRWSAFGGGVRRLRQGGRRDRVRRLRARRGRRARCSAIVVDGRARRAARAGRSRPRSCWTARRSTASRAARSATPASSTPATARFRGRGHADPVAGVIAHVGTLESGALAVGRRRCTRPSTSCAASASGATTPPRTCCTGRCASCSASTSSRPARYVAPDRLRFDFTHFEAMTARAARQGRAARQRQDHREPPRPRVRDVARERARERASPRCSARSTATSCACSRSATSPRSCAAARTSAARARSACSRSSARAASARTCAASRPSRRFDAYDYVMREEAELARPPPCSRCRASTCRERAAADRQAPQGARGGRRPRRRSRGRRRASAVCSARPSTSATSSWSSRVRPMRPTGLRSIWDVLRARGADAARAGRRLTPRAASRSCWPRATTPRSLRVSTRAALVKQMAAVLGGRGGGKPSMAQGGGENVDAIDEALRLARDTLGVG